MISFLQQKYNFFCFHFATPCERHWIIMFGSRYLRSERFFRALFSRAHLLLQFCTYSCRESCNVVDFFVCHVNNFFFLPSSSQFPLTSWSNMCESFFTLPLTQLNKFYQSLCASLYVQLGEFLPYFTAKIRFLKVIKVFILINLKIFGLVTSAKGFSQNRFSENIAGGDFGVSRSDLLEELRDRDRRRRSRRRSSLRLLSLARFTP